MCLQVMQLQMWMNVPEACIIIVILVRLAIILKGVIVARAILDLRAMVFLVQVINYMCFPH